MFLFFLIFIPFFYQNITTDIWVSKLVGIITRSI